MAGDAANFDSAANYNWLMADFTDAITTFDASAFNLSTANFSNAFGGAFGIARGDTVGGDSSQLYLTCAAVPEPSMVALLLGGGAGVFWMLRRQRAA